MELNCKVIIISTQVDMLHKSQAQTNWFLRQKSAATASNFHKVNCCVCFFFFVVVKITKHTKEISICIENLSIMILIDCCPSRPSTKRLKKFSVKSGITCGRWVAENRTSIVSLFFWWKFWTETTQNENKTPNQIN